MTPPQPRPKPQRGGVWGQGSHPALGLGSKASPRRGFGGPNGVLTKWGLGVGGPIGPQNHPITG